MMTIMEKTLKLTLCVCILRRLLITICVQFNTNVTSGIQTQFLGVRLHQDSDQNIKCSLFLRKEKCLRNYKCLCKRCFISVVTFFRFQCSFDGSIFLLDDLSLFVVVKKIEWTSLSRRRTCGLSPLCGLKRLSIVFWYFW